MNNISIIEKFINDFFFTTNKYETHTQNTDFIENNIHILKKNLFREVNVNKTQYTYKIYDNIISNNLCDYIINESEKYSKRTANSINPTGWTTTRHSNYPTTDLQVSSIPSLAILINNIVKYDVIPLLSKLYNLNRYFLDCNDIFIVKYDANQQSELMKHKDGSIFSFNILLNHESEFEGGGTIFYSNNDANNETLVKNKKGGLLIHPGFVFHSGNKITKGKRYLLVGFVNYYKNVINKVITYDLKNKSNVNLNSWQIKMETKNKDLIIDYISNTTSGTHILNTNKIMFTLVEKIIYELAMFHFKRLNIEYDPNRYFIEYWWKSYALSNKQLTLSNEIHAFHSDKDEETYKNKNRELIHPFLATVTYLNDSLFPTLITSTPEKLQNNNSQIILDKGLLLSFPKELKHICFSPENIHGVYNVFKDNQKDSINYRMALMFNLWDNHYPTANTPKMFQTKNKDNEEIPTLNEFSPETQFKIQNYYSNVKDIDNVNLSINTQICEKITPMSNKLSIKLEENEMFEFLKKIQSKTDTIIINNYITTDTISSYDIIEFDI